MLNSSSCRPSTALQRHRNIAESARQATPIKLSLLWLSRAFATATVPPHHGTWPQSSLVVLVTLCSTHRPSCHPRSFRRRLQLHHTACGMVKKAATKWLIAQSRDDELAAQNLIRGLDDRCQDPCLGLFESPPSGDPLRVLRDFVDKVSPAGCDKRTLETNHHGYSVADLECR